MTTVLTALPSPGPALHVDLGGLMMRLGRSAPGRRRRGMGLSQRAVVLAYAAAAELRAEDHAVLLNLEAFLDGSVLTVTAPCPWLGDRGPVRLTPMECSMHFQRLVIGSGDARLAPSAHAMRTVGLHVTVVHRTGLSAPDLARAGDALVPLRKVNRRRVAKAVASGRIARLPRP
jgi:hypothetical protein